MTIDAMQEIEYEFEFTEGMQPVEKVARGFKTMSDGARATVAGVELSEITKKMHEPYSHDSNGHVLANFYLVNMNGAATPSTAAFVHNALRLIAHQNWVDYLDYLDNGRKVRYFFFYMEGQDER